MAIIEELGLQVRILCGDTPCPEHEDAEPDGDLNTINDFPPNTPSTDGYVESREDVEFHIELNALPGSRAIEWIKKNNNILVFSPRFDGDKTRETAAVVQQSHNPGMSYGYLDRREGTLHKYRFAAISLVESADKDRLAQDTKKAQSLGSIRIVVRRAVKLGVKVPEAESASSTPPKDGDDFSLSEKALKVGDAGLTVS